jgi:Sulfotransferase family
MPRFARARVASAAPGIARVFIVGCPRSGTTWTRAILRRHDSVVSGEESHMFPVLYEALRSKPRPTRWRGKAASARWRGAVLAAFDGFASDRADEPIGPDRWIERPVLEQLLDSASAAGLSGDDAAKHVLEGIADSFFVANRGPASSVLVEKTPGHLAFADRILTWWPEARVIEVVRDGRDVAVSLDHKSKVEAWAPGDRAEQIDVWVKAVRRGAQLRARPDLAPRWHMVRYEDLAANGVDEVRRLFAFLELPVDDDFVAATVEACRIDNMRTSGNANHLRAGVAGGWAQAFTDDERRRFAAIAGDELVQLGYEP